MLELGSWLLFSPLLDLPLDRPALSALRRERIARLDDELAGRRGATTSIVAHPYLGFVGRPGADHPQYVTGASPPSFNEYGVLSIAGNPYPSKREPGAFVLGVLGGSVAEIFANTQQAVLEQLLRDLEPRFRRDLVMINLANGGFKEPQQLFHLQYALLLGFEFDAVLNIDGFNDLVFASTNVGSGVQPIYPSGYHMGLLYQLRPGGDLHPRTVEALSEYHALKRTERRVLALVEHTPLRASAFFNLLATGWFVRSAERQKQILHRTHMEAPAALPPELRGPRRPWPSNPHVAAAELWQRSSLMLDAICKTSGLPYIHVLQPNQYDEGSKPMGEEERRIAIRPDHEWGRHARAGYGFLRARGEELRAQGVAFYDLSMIFRDRSEPVYRDDCCHFNARGNKILARRLAEILRRHLGDSLAAGQ
jgi:hypothetical protein